MQPPTTVTEVRSFLGLVGYYQDLIPHYAELAVPLTDLTRKNATYEWTQEHQNAFVQLKQAIASQPIVIPPDPTKPFQLLTDASDRCIGAVLCQEIDGVRHPIY